MAFTKVVSQLNFSNSQYELEEPNCSKEEIQWQKKNFA